MPRISLYCEKKYGMGMGVCKVKAKDARVDKLQRKTVLSSPLLSSLSFSL